MYTRSFFIQWVTRLLNQPCPAAKRLDIVDGRWLTETARPSKPRHYGLLRLVRDIWHISGFVEQDEHAQLTRIVLNHLAPLARGLGMALHQLLAPSQVVVNWGQI